MKYKKDYTFLLPIFFIAVYSFYSIYLVLSLQNEIRTLTNKNIMLINSCGIQ